MNKYPTIISLLLSIGILTLSLVVAPAVLSQESEATQSGEPESETIRENVRRRIQEVITDRRSTFASQAAYVGKLESRTVNTLTLATREGVQLASASAELTIDNLKNNNSLSFDDIEIEDFISVIGDMSSDGVLNATHIMVASSPVEPIEKPFFGIVTELDEDTNELTVTNPQGEEVKMFSINNRSVLEASDASAASSEIDFEEIQLGATVALISTPANNPEDPAIVTRLLMKYGLAQESVSEPELEDATDSATLETTGSPTP